LMKLNDAGKLNAKGPDLTRAFCIWFFIDTCIQFYRGILSAY
jgi:hypothetical protein